MRELWCHKCEVRMNLIGKSHEVLGDKIAYIQDGVNYEEPISKLENTPLWKCPNCFSLVFSGKFFER